MLLALVAIVVALVGVWVLWPRSAITRENGDALKVGMTRTQVEAILGGPARDESTGQLVAELDEPFEDARERELQEQNRVDMFARGLWGGDRDPERSKCWVSDEMMIRIDFDDEGLVIRTQTMQVHRVAESPLDVLRRWLRL